MSSVVEQQLYIHTVEGIPNAEILQATFEV